MAREKNVRMCTCCHVRLDKNDLIKISKVENEFKINYKGNSTGKSVYVCKDCLKKLIDKKLLNRALKCEVSDDFYSMLKEYEQTKNN